ncbi:hypothetical protein [Kordia jejudonensis]|uniref:hypothetical protein n=1 Tax=Kordia jejudonensis TaxID=1348245 RepID=UPI0012E04C01|nr:hypothetical protein [Kordia jejudonensis]
MKKKNFKSLTLNKSTVNMFTVFGGEEFTVTCTFGSVPGVRHCHLGPREDTLDRNCPTV